MKPKTLHVFDGDTIRDQKIIGNVVVHRGGKVLGCVIRGYVYVRTGGTMCICEVRYPSYPRTYKTKKALAEFNRIAGKEYGAFIAEVDAEYGKDTGDF